jgi:hypothetical protein
LNLCFETDCKPNTSLDQKISKASLPATSRTPYTNEEVEVDENEDDIEVSDLDDEENTNDLNILIDDDSDDEFLGDVFNGFEQLTLDD